MTRPRRPSDPLESETSFISILSVMMLLIPAMLLTMEVTRFASIDVSPPRTCSRASASTVPKPPLNLKVVIAEDGFRLTGRHPSLEISAGRLAESQRPTIPLARPGTTLEDVRRYDYHRLEAEARRLKQLFPHESVVTLEAQSDIPFQVLTRTLDALRGGACKLPRDEVPPASCLFFQPIVQA